jgi:hypothetical protein
MGAIIKKKSPAQHSLPTHEKTLDPQKKKKTSGHTKRPASFPLFSFSFYNPKTTFSNQLSELKK